MNSDEILAQAAKLDEQAAKIQADNRAALKEREEEIRKAAAEADLKRAQRRLDRAKAVGGVAPAPSVTTPPQDTKPEDTKPQDTKPQDTKPAVLSTTTGRKADDSKDQE